MRAASNLSETSHIARLQVCRNQQQNETSKERIDKKNKNSKISIKALADAPTLELVIGTIALENAKFEERYDRFILGWKGFGRK